VQGICPSGWHVPTDAEWCSVTNFLDATVNCSAIGWSGTDAGGKMKETGTIHWNSPNLGATNNSGFTALPGGNRSNTSGSFDYLSSNSYWWSSSLYDTSYPRIRGMVNDNAQVYRLYNHKSYGFSVRCLKN
jgi:uncharacterized protein (TIGR02145 family)